MTGPPRHSPRPQEIVALAETLKILNEDISFFSSFFIIRFCLFVLFTYDYS